MAVSGFWKISLIVQLGDYGDTISHVWNGPNKSLADAITVANDLAHRYRFWFANSASNLAQNRSLDRDPVIRYARVTDAQFPRIGKLVTFSTVYNGYPGLVNPGGLDNNPDAPSSCISTRFACVPADPGAGLPSYAPRPTLTLRGFPDVVLDRGYQIQWNRAWAGGTFQAAVEAYVAMLVRGDLGVMGERLDAPPVNVGSWAFDGTQWVATTPAPHAFTTNDRVRLTGNHLQSFSGTYAITVLTATTFALQFGPPKLSLTPAGGKARRVQLADGRKVSQFYAYTLPDLYTTQDNWSYAKRNVGRRFSKVSFRRRARRPK